MNLYTEKMTNKEIIKELTRLSGYIRELSNDTEKGMEIFLDNLKGEKSYMESQNYMNKNYSKHAMKRKITTLRQELMNVSNLLDQMDIWKK